MPELKTKSVAVLYNADGTCKLVCVATHVSELQYKKLVNEMVASQQKEKEEKESLWKIIIALKVKVKQLDDEIKVLKGEDENE